MNNQNIFCKTLKSIKGVSIGLARRIIPAFDVFYNRRVAGWTGHELIRLTPISFQEYCNSYGGKITIVEESKDRVVYEPTYYPEGGDKEYTFKSPEIYVAELTDVEVHGGTGLVIAGEYVLTDIVSNDVDNRVKYTSGKILRGEKKAFYVETSVDADEVDAAVNLCGLAADNYYHLTVEILSRFAYVKDVCADNVTVLLDEQARMFPQYEDLIHTVLGNVLIKYVPLCTRVRCKKLLYPSMNTWMPYNIKKRNGFRLSDNLIAESAVTNIRKPTENLRKDKTDIKVFISRKNVSKSRVINEEEVVELFEKAGYRIVCTEELTYKEQVELFSSASCVVGATGAALTNFVYCNPKAVVGCIIPKKYEFCIYSTIAHMVGCRCLFFDAKIVEKHRAISEEQYYVDLETCLGYIDSLEKLITI